MSAPARQVATDPRSVVDAQQPTSESALLQLRDIARELGARELADEAEAAGRRLADRRFFVACVGQFKRGKSTLLNALVRQSVLPVGVEPVTSVVTVLRAGEPARARATWHDGRSESFAIAELAAYVDERRNPGNRRGVAGIEVFLPSPILSDGLCLVDTPGVGSVFEANTAATNAFLPHVDAALVVLGADPPVSQVELRVIVELARDVADLVFVLNKADRQSPAELGEASAFTARVLSGALGRPPGPLLSVSALERGRGEVTRDWDFLVSRLRDLSGTRRTGLLAHSESRTLKRLVERLETEIEERIRALTRPLHESEARVARLRAVLADADRSLVDLSHLLTATEANLGRAFEARREAFLAEARLSLIAELGAWANETARDVTAGGLRTRGYERAREAVFGRVEAWRIAVEPDAERLYEGATARFVSLANDCLARVAADGGVGRTLTVEPGFHERRHFFFASLMSLTGAGLWAWLADLLFPRGRRVRDVSAAIRGYATHLLETNAMRVENDLRERVLESRRWLERSVRRRLEEAVSTGDRALREAREQQAEGEGAVRQRVEHLEGMRSRTSELRRRTAAA